MVLSRAFLCLWILLLGPALFAQENRYMVFFKDKNGSPHDVSSPQTFLGEQAINRRVKYNIPITPADIPVTPAYVTELNEAGAGVIHTTRWMNGALVELEASLISTLEALEFVDRVEWVAPGGKPNSSGRRRYAAKRSSDVAVAVTDTQLKMLGIDKMHAAGYRGEGITIAVFDAGFPNVDVVEPFAHVFTEGRYNAGASYNFVYDSPEVFQLDDHGTEVFSIIAAHTPGTFVGGAYKANYQLYITEDVFGEHHIEEYNWLFAAERADSAGVDIISSSLGYNIFNSPSTNYTIADLDGNTAIVTKAAQWAADRGILVVVSAGNEGGNSWQFVTPPADALDVLAVGAVTSSVVRSPTSSKGPTADGRIKPNVVALGVGTSVIKTNGNTGTSSGTSLAAPLITSLAAGVMQAYPDLSNVQVMTLLQTTASQAETPDNFLGYGLPNFLAVYNKQEWKSQEQLIHLYPNPVIDTLFVRPQSPVDISSCTIEVISLQGQVIASEVVEFDWLNRTYPADCTSLQAGMYFLRVWLGSQIFSFKVVKL